MQYKETRIMKKIYLKLIAISLTLILSVSVVAMSSYAWLVLSGNPAVSGIQVVIGGGNTILIAPELESLAAASAIYQCSISISQLYTLA